MLNFEFLFLFSLKFPVNFLNITISRLIRYPITCRKINSLPSPGIAHPEYVNIAVVVEIRLHGLVV